MKFNPNPDWTEHVPNASTFADARANLEHTLQVFGDQWDDADHVVTATQNVYGRGVWTGLTVGDLRLIAQHIGAVTK